VKHLARTANKAVRNSPILDGAHQDRAVLISLQNVSLTQVCQTLICIQEVRSSILLGSTKPFPQEGASFSRVFAQRLSPKG